MKLMNRNRFLLSTTGDYWQVISCCWWDINAEIGSQNDNYKIVMGRHGLGSVNENGPLFADFCLETDLAIEGSTSKSELVYALTREIIWMSWQQKENHGNERKHKRISWRYKENIRKPQQSNKPVKDRNGILLTTLEEQMNRWGKNILNSC